MKILIAILHEGEIAAQFMQNPMFSDSRYDVEVLLSNHRPQIANRNKIIKHFLSGDADYLLMIDDDNPPIQNPLDLVEEDKDMIGLAVPGMAEGEMCWNVYKRHDDGYKAYTEKQTGKWKVDAVASSCILIARRVLEKVPVWPQREWEDGLAVKGHDLKFCELIQEEGFEVWVNWDYFCSHFKIVDLLKFSK